MENKLALAAEFAAANIETKEQRQALIYCFELLQNPEDEDKIAQVKGALPYLRDLVENQKRAEAVCKNIKEITEPAIFMVKEDAEEGKFFKFSKESFTKKIVDYKELYSRMIAGGTPADKILEFATITIKDAAECLGMSEHAFEDTFADLIEKTPRKPTMKAM